MSRNLIKKLLKNYATRDILADEQKVDFEANKEVKYNFPSYGPPSHHGSGFYGPSAGNQ